jgi:hypothetical protein
MPEWKLAIIESPYGGTPAEQQYNLRYLRACMHWCLKNGYAPFSSHGQYTQPGVLRDEYPEERRKGIEAGFAWGAVADVSLFFTDLGWSSGMKAADAQFANHARQDSDFYRVIKLGPNWEQEWIGRVSEEQSVAWTDLRMVGGVTGRDDPSPGAAEGTIRGPSFGSPCSYVPRGLVLDD